MPETAYIYDAVRTPRGKGKSSGALHGTKPVDLVVGLIEALRERLPGLDENRISDLVLGIVSPVGDQGMVLPRTAALLAGTGIVCPPFESYVDSLVAYVRGRSQDGPAVRSVDEGRPSLDLDLDEPIS